MASPAHVHNDPHPTDKYEWWMENSYYSRVWLADQILGTEHVVGRELDRRAASDCHREPARLAQNYSSTLTAGQRSDLFRLFLDMAEIGDDYQSDDYDGESFTHSGYLRMWTATFTPCALVPEAIRHVAGLYQLFWDETHPLTVALSAAPDPVRPGEVVQYAVTVTNRYTTSEWLHAYAQVPDHATVAASAISAGGSCGQGVTTCGAGQTISWSLGYVGAGGSVTVMYTARVDTVNPPAAGTVLRSTASADAVASGAGSAAPVAVDVLVAGAADLAMGMTAAPGSVVPGGTLSYVVSFGNPNATSAPAAVLAMPVPAGTTVVSASAGGTLVDGAVQWEVAALAAGASGQRQVAVQVDAGLPDKSVLVAAAELRDPVTGRSLARGNAVTPVLSAPGLLAALSAAPDPVRPGEAGAVCGDGDQSVHDE